MAANKTAAKKEAEVTAKVADTKTDEVKTAKEAPAAKTEAVEEVKAAEPKKPGRKPAAEKAPAKKPGRKPAAEKKAPAKKETAGKEAAKKETAPAEVKQSLHVEYAGKSVAMEDMINVIKGKWAEAHKESDLKSIDLYVQPENNKVYYVVNGGEAEDNFDI